MASVSGVGTAPKTIFQTSLTEVSAFDLEGVGTIRWNQYGDVFRWVQNTNAAAMAAGDVVSHDLSDTSAIFQKVDEGATADLSVMGGVTMGAIPISGYGWIQVLGYNATASVTNSATTAIVAGDWLVPVNGANYAARGSAATAPLYVRNLQILEAVATAAATLTAAAAKSVMVNCL